MENKDSGTHERFSASAEEDRGARVVYAVGELDLATVPQLREELQRASANGASQAEDTFPHVALDLSGISFVDSSGLALLIEQRNVLRERGGDLWLVDAEDGTTRHLLEVAELEESFQLYSTRAATVEKILEVTKHS